MKAGEHGSGRTGKAEKKHAIAVGGERVTAGPDVNIVENRGEPASFRATAGKVPLAPAGSACGDDDVRQFVMRQELNQGFFIVREHPGFNNVDTALLKQSFCQHEVVCREPGCVAVRSATDGVGQFAAKGQDPGFGFRVDAYGLHAGPNHDRCRLWRDRDACLGNDGSQADLIACLAHVPSLAGGFADDDCPAIEFDVLFCQDRIRARGDQAAGQDTC